MNYCINNLIMMSLISFPQNLYEVIISVLVEACLSIPVIHIITLFSDYEREVLLILMTLAVHWLLLLFSHFLAADINVLLLGLLTAFILMPSKTMKNIT